VKREMATGEIMEKGSFPPPEFPTPYLCLSDGILQAANYRTHFKIQSEIETKSFV